MVLIQYLEHLEPKELPLLKLVVYVEGLKLDEEQVETKDLL
nr:MAG TPA: hypothetical protein [Caudoviricetes sp.]